MMCVSGRGHDLDIYGVRKFICTCLRVRVCERVSESESEKERDIMT